MPVQKKPSKDAALNVLEFIANEALEAIAKFEAVQSDDNMSELFATRMRLKMQLDELKAARAANHSPTICTSTGRCVT